MLRFVSSVLPDSLWPSSWCSLRANTPGAEAEGALHDDARQLRERMTKIDSMHEQMREADTFQEWCQAAVKLDVLEGREMWKVKAESPFYDYKLIQAHTELLQGARCKGNLKMLQYHIRASMHRNFGGYEDLRLYEHTHVGTKYLVDDYVSQVIYSMKEIADQDSEQFSVAKRLAFFKEIRRIYGRSALLLSGGSVFGLYHLGVIKALAQANLLPRVISGSSAGSLVAALVAVKTDEELLPLLEPGALRLDLFGSGENFLSKFKRIITEGVFADITYLQQSCRDLIGDITFEEAFERTRRSLSISVTVMDHDRPHPKLLNHLTAPNVLIWSAIIASCAAPGLFRPVELLCKQPNGTLQPFDAVSRQFLDGSYVNDLPMEEISEMFGVNFFIVSQVNPYVIPFMKGLQKRPPTQDGTENAGFVSRLINLFQDFVKSEIHHRCVQLKELRLAPKMLQFLVPVIDQVYSGDVTIVPQFRNCIRNYVTLLSNPSLNVIQGCIKSGLQSTWPALSMIRNHCEIETVILRCVDRLREQYYKSFGPQCSPSLMPSSSLHWKQSSVQANAHSARWWHEAAAAAAAAAARSGSGGDAPQMCQASVVVSALGRIGLLGDIAVMLAEQRLMVMNGYVTTCGHWAFARFQVRLAVPLGQTDSVAKHLRQCLETFLSRDSPKVLVKFCQHLGEQ